jgi:MoxR-like ATPase
VTATRGHADLALGASPRASLALFKTAQALAALRGRDHVIPDDIKYLVPAVVIHRLIVHPEAELRGRSATEVVGDLVASTPLGLGSVK